MEQVRLTKQFIFILGERGEGPIFKTRSIWAPSSFAFLIVRLTQAEFSEINVVAHANGTCNVNMQVLRNGTRIMRWDAHGKSYRGSVALGMLCVTGGGGKAVASTGRLAAKRLQIWFLGLSALRLHVHVGSLKLPPVNGDSNVSVGVSVGGSLSVWPHGRRQHWHIKAPKVLEKFPSPVFSNNNGFLYIANKLHFDVTKGSYPSLISLPGEWQHLQPGICSAPWDHFVSVLYHTCGRSNKASAGNWDSVFLNILGEGCKEREKYDVSGRSVKLFGKKINK